MALNDGQIERYSRHILLSEIGGSGQAALLSGSAFVVGAGGLGSPALLYLAAAGVGRIGLIDSDAVELSNLQRQVLHRTEDVGRLKAVSAEETLREVNPDIEVVALKGRLDASNARQILGGYDVVLDGSDNFPTRFLVADCCHFEGIPLVSAAVLGFEGQLLTVLPGEGNPCYRCFLPEPPPAGSVPSCQQAGVLGAAVGVMGTLQATEAIKTLLGLGESMSHRLLVYDALGGDVRIVKRTPDPACPLCGEEPTITELTETEQAECCPGGRCDLQA
jgi:adenylyltransferase/sulfurtransferase